MSFFFFLAPVINSSSFSLHFLLSTPLDTARPRAGWVWRIRKMWSAGHPWRMPLTSGTWTTRSVRHPC